MLKKVITIIFALIVCGCKNKMICIHEEKYDNIKIINKAIFNFKSNNYKTIDTMIFESEKEAQDYFNDIRDYEKEYNLILNENQIVSELNYDIDKKDTKRTLKQKYEAYDYKCK